MRVNSAANCSGMRMGWSSSSPPHLNGLNGILCGYERRRNAEGQRLGTRLDDVVALPELPEERFIACPSCRYDCELNCAHSAAEI